jgi:mitochondrial import receptor subunit TOM40
MFDGAKFDFGQGISPNMQLSHSFHMGSQVVPPTYSLSSIYAAGPVFLNGSVDHAFNMTGRANYGLTRHLTAKFQGQMAMQATAPGLAQFEVDYQGVDYSTNVKAINPALAPAADGSAPRPVTGIFVFSHLQSLSKNVALGVEVAAQRPDPKVFETQASVVMRVRGREWVWTTNVAQFGVLQTSYWQKLNENVELGAELQLMANRPQQQQQQQQSARSIEGVATLGGKWDAGFVVVRCQVDTAGRVGSTMEQKLAPGISFLMSADLDHMKGASKFGMGLQMES